MEVLTEKENCSPEQEKETEKERKGQRFIKNNQYFTICIYAAAVVLFSAVIFKCVIDFDKTKAWIRQMINMVSPFLFGALLAYVLNPMVHMFYIGIEKLMLKSKGRIKLKHSAHTILSILFTYCIVLGFVALTFVYIVPAITKNIVDFVNYLPSGYKVMMGYVDHLEDRFPNLNLSGLSQALSETVPQMMASIQDFAANLVPKLYSISVSIAGWVVNLLITLIVSIYMLYDKRKIMQSSWKLVYAFAPEKHIVAFKEIVSQGNRIFSSFVVGKFIDSLIIGLLCFSLMNILRMPYSLLISLIVGVTNMIPYFGPFIGAIPGVLIILFISPLQALGFIVMILCLQQFDGLILGPKILGDSIGMKPLWIIFAITVGGKLAGFIGMFLGVPVVAFLSSLAERYLDHRLRKKQISEKDVEGALKNLELDD